MPKSETSKLEFKGDSKADHSGRLDGLEALVATAYVIEAANRGDFNSIIKFCGEDKNGLRMV